MSCEQYGIGIDFRPPGNPAIGGLIERTIGTMMSRVRLLPGASYSELLGKAPRRADKLARMTLAELNHYLALQISIYHQTHHKGLGMTPAKAWEIGWKVNGIVATPRVPDLDGFRMSFLPSVWRTVGRGAVKLWHMLYTAEGLRAIEGSRLVRYDPRDMSKVYVEVDGGYVVAKLADLSVPPFSLWEAQALRKHRREEGGAPNPEQLARDLLASRDMRESLAKRGTSGAAREHARQLEWKKAQGPWSQPILELPQQSVPSGAGRCRVEDDE